MIEHIVAELQIKFGAKLVGKIGPHKEVGDIDFYSKIKNQKGLQSYLIKKNFSIRYLNKRGTLAYTFSNGQLFQVDVAHSRDLLLDLYPKTSFTELFYDNVWEDINFEKFFRYIFPLRKEAKYLKHVELYFDVYGQYLWDDKYVVNSPFRDGVSKQDVIGAMQKRPYSLLRAYRLKSLLELVWQLVLVRWRRINSGHIIAFVGSDGSGKTTAIEHIYYALGIAKPTRVQYMGDFWFKLQPFYIWLHQQHISIARLSYLFFYLENWCRYFKIRYWKFRGYIVLTDRWPGLNRHLRKPGFLLKFNDWMYALYPEPDAYIFLSADPKVVHKRKPELTVEEIEVLQMHMRERLAKKQRSYEAVNDDLDDCLNGILSYIYKEFTI